MNRDGSPWSGYRKRGGALRVGRIMCVWVDNVCVFYVSVLFVFILCLVYSMLSVHSQSPEVSTSLLEKKIFIIDDQHFSKFFLFFPLMFESSSDCGPFLICTSVFSQAPGSRIIFFY